MENTCKPSEPHFMNPTSQSPWNGLRAAARERLETRNYSKEPLVRRLATSGVDVAEAIHGRDELADAWIPGVEIFPRRVFQQKGRGYFAELTRLSEGVLERIGLSPKQWASAMMHRDSAKGFHIHPPHVPDGHAADQWFRELFIEKPAEFSRRPYDREQWDVMFFLTGICEMILVDEREGLTRRIMRFTICGDSRPGNNNAAVVIPPGVGHALRSIGNEDLIMVYGTSTTFNPEWEGRIESGIENAPLPADWSAYLENDGR
jgi:dTDP-4-dehydrorhamnose 3,5-epimerase-like enzyme